MHFKPSLLLFSQFSKNQIFFKRNLNFSQKDILKKNYFFIFTANLLKIDGKKFSKSKSQ